MIENEWGRLDMGTEQTYIKVPGPDTLLKERKKKRKKEPANKLMEE